MVATCRVKRDCERVLVLVDADNDDVAELERRLESLKASLQPAPVVVFRFAIEETEAFYLADLKPLAAAFPDFDQALARSYVPDSICGTWELFGRVVGDGGGNKVAWAHRRVTAPACPRQDTKSRSRRSEWAWMGASLTRVWFERKTAAVRARG